MEISKREENVKFASELVLTDPHRTARRSFRGTAKWLKRKTLAGTLENLAPILSPLRLPVPPSRLIRQVTESVDLLYTFQLMLGARFCLTCRRTVAVR
jgi:hypothetical protein